MMNQGGSGLDPNIAKHYQGVDASEGHVSLTTGQHSWSSSTGPVPGSWNSYGTENSRMENGTPSTSGYFHQPQKAMTVAGDIQVGVSSAPSASTSLGMGSGNVTHGYENYVPYSSTTDPYPYNNTDYRYHYQQPASGSSTQQVGAYQNSGAPYPPFRPFHHADSYVAPTSYQGTYYNPGDYQTAAGHLNNNYSNQCNYWNDGSSRSYASSPYISNTSSDSSSTQTSNLPASSLHYQHYGHWPYNNPYPPAVSSTPGAENVFVSSTSTSTIPFQAASGSCSYPSNQPPPPGTTAWGRDFGSSWPPVQGQNSAMAGSLNASWEAPPVSHNHQMSQTSSNFQKPLDLNPVPPEKCEAQHMTQYSQGPNLQPPETSQSHLQASTMSETRRVSKLQIPTNPRIASGLGLGMGKESSTTNVALKPAYISVPVTKPSNALSSRDDDDAVMKGVLPASLRGYVERAFARCKDDSQRAANQKIMKEVITKATAEGSLFTRNWDSEPLFPLPTSSSDFADQNTLQSSVAVSMLSKYKRSPSKRTKSRWEPVAEDKLVEKPAPVSYVSTNVVTWNQFKGGERVVGSIKNESKDNGWSGIKFVSAQTQTPLSKITRRPKKQRFSDPTDVAQNGDASSDSDKEQGLTKYYASALALADSPEEKKRREHRSKRFEKGQKTNAEIKHYKTKVSGAGNIYTRRESAVLLARTFEDSSSRPVEDIDWDALTVKGTCQEVEKRYLRLTSAPDPTTVRPEEILEKALNMVHTSQKNYLYKCDQLKSIRQDLTVQRIQNELTVKVYETHARLALEAGDLPEYNQCQSKLKSLYAEGIKGCHLEFSAYNLLCVILHSNNNRDLLSAMRRLSNEAKEDQAVKHALAVRSAVLSGNYILFFRLYKDGPNLNTCLMDLYVERMRFEAIKCISKSCRPTVPVVYIARSLGFPRVDQREHGKELNRLDECEEWLKAHGAVLTVDNSGEVHLDTKASSSSLYMPEPEDAVAHGDASLAVNDFLTRASS
ncbi:SAC3 family protein A isoform X1 [Iris pallida]|uniref:SAC3 family protein A isoform X1 n=1 Tax=Iris pallida TaxID=29817 RepID=A0AAX6G097_IRIPA|nr:SAC3 family protein A isoform X1 [Iris pallida]